MILQQITPDVFGVWLGPQISGLSDSIHIQGHTPHGRRFPLQSECYLAIEKTVCMFSSLGRQHRGAEVGSYSERRTKNNLAASCCKF